MTKLPAVVLTTACLLVISAGVNGVLKGAAAGLAVWARRAARIAVNRESIGVLYLRWW
jgi:hypothetical protein